MLVKPKDKDPLDRKSGTIYWNQYGELTCNEQYMGETSGTFGERYKEYLKEPSPIHAHSTTPENFNIIGREDQSLAITIKESVYVRVNNSILNRNVGKYNLHSLTLKLMTMGFHKEHPSVGMLSPFQPIGICIEL